MDDLVSIVIPTWNRCYLALRCLESVYAQTHKNFEVVLVDDHSTDGTAETIKERFPDVCIVVLSENVGFARAVNIGISHSRAPLVFLLNNDMVLDKQCLEFLVGAATTSDQTTAMFAPLILSSDGQRVYAAGDAYTRGFRPVSICHGEEYNRFVPPELIFGVCAGAALYRRILFDRIGLFDEEFGAYFEDADLCFRARWAGFSAKLVSEARAYHEGSASLKGRHLWRARQCCRNHFQLLVKNVPMLLLLRYFPWIGRERVHQLGRVFSLARCEKSFAWGIAQVLDVWRFQMLVLPHALRERMRIQRARKQTRADVVKCLEETLCLTNNHSQSYGRLRGGNEDCRK